MMDSVGVLCGILLAGMIIYWAKKLGRVKKHVFKFSNIIVVFKSVFLQNIRESRYNSF